MFSGNAGQGLSVLSCGAPDATLFLSMLKKLQSQSRQRTNPRGKPVSNKILLAIPDEEFRRLRPHIEYVDLPHHRTLSEPNQKIEFVYFPNRGLLSLVVITEEGQTVEAGVLGSEGLAGIPSAIGMRSSPLREVVQISGDGFRVRATALQEMLKSAPELHGLLHHYAVLLGLQVAQTAACNRLHNLEQRLARWLLMTQDRVDDGLLPITHDFLATMLGTDRPSVSLAAAVLQKRRLIQYVRGAVRILNRKKLEATACECYSVIQQFNGELGIR
jgi:CRP-like cAMP-binding protein